MAKGIEKEIMHFSDVIESISNENKNQNTILKAIKEEMSINNSLLGKFFGVKKMKEDESEQSKEEKESERKKRNKETYKRLYGESTFDKLKNLFTGGAKAEKEKAIASEEKKKELSIFEQQAEDVSAIRKMLEPKTEKIKGGAFDKLKGLFGGKLGGAGASMFSKLFGVGLIFGGILWMINDFIKGFMEDGITGGLARAFLGQAEGGIMSIMKNAGKYALIGGGIGLMVGGPIGGIIGGLAGAAIGGLLNGIYQLIKGTGTTGDKISSAVFGASTGPMATLFNGMKWASIGFLVGLPFGGPIGGLIGAGIGFIIGSLVNIVWQLIGEDGQKAVSGLFDKAVAWMGDIWDSIGGIFKKFGSIINEIVESTPILKAMSNWFNENIWGPISNLFSSVGSWIKDKFTNWWKSGDDKKPVKNDTGKKTFEKVKKTTKSLFGGLTGGMGTGSETTSARKIKEKEITSSKRIQSSIRQWLEKIYIFISDSLVSKLDASIKNNLDILFGKMEVLNTENRMWADFQAGGKPGQFASKYDSFNQQMNNMKTSEKQALQNAMLNSVDNRTNIVNNMGSKRRQKLKNK